ncbi:arylalkylamine N-acetyltransferase 1-like [Onthophagus taurus]|uniref:arylalkylamine N-acetyltransferase 1-like n=1 Tax=Onthophagus taurus TaxID=166361 RepID=UPI0039BDAD14
MNLSYAILTESDTPKVQQFLKKFFYKDEPLNVCVKLWEREETIKSLEIYSTLPIKYNCSLKALNDKNEIVGVCLNKIRTKIETDDVNFEDPVFSQIVGIMEKGDTECKIFEKYPNIDQYLQHDIVSVDPNIRGQGIATKLLDMSRDVAIKRGIKLLRVDCTSLFSAKAAERLGFERIYTLKYSDYKINGKQVFKPEEPHTEFCVYCKRIGWKSSKL